MVGNAVKVMDRHGKEGGEYAFAFMDDLRARPANRVQLTTERRKAYLNWVEEAFEADGPRSAREAVGRRLRRGTRDAGQVRNSCGSHRTAKAWASGTQRPGKRSRKRAKARSRNGSTSSDSAFDRTQFVNAYQRGHPLTSGERCPLAITLRITLVENLRPSGRHDRGATRGKPIGQIRLRTGYSALPKTIPNRRVAAQGLSLRAEHPYP